MAHVAVNLERLAKFILENLQNFNPKTIVEIGARDCNETIAMHQLFSNAKILTFECNPSQLPECRARVKDIPQITLIEKAVSNQSGTVKFYPIDQEKTETTWKDGNPGASSLLKASGKYKLEHYVQNEVEVECTTLIDELPKHRVDSVDILWMDIQGSELNALKGLGDKIKDVAVIHAEVEFAEIYQGQPLFWDIKRYLNSRGFYLAMFTSFYKNYSGDAVFINFNLSQLGILQKIKYRLTNKALHLLHHYGFLK
jgi:FkbM family methyltransferase